MITVDSFATIKIHDDSCFLIIKSYYLVYEYKWDMPWENLSSGISDQVRLKPACSAAETS